MQLKPEEISKVIRSQIKYYENAIRQDETGTVLMVGDGIARASGLSNCMAGELLEFEDGSYGMAQNLEENSVSVVLFGSGENISEGQLVKRTGKVVSVPVGEGMIGRVVNALGQPIDGAGPITAAGYRPIESPAPGICERKGVNQPLQTGIKAIDSMVPIGRSARADHRRPSDRKDNDRNRYHSEPERQGCDLYLRCHRTETFDSSVLSRKS